MIVYGWGKDLKKVAYSGIEKCPNCKNYGHFWVCEHSWHAKLYFVKVAKWNKRLLYMCDTCKRGWEIEESAREDAIKRTIGLPTLEQCLELWNRLNSDVNNALTAAAVQGQEQTVRVIGSAINETVKDLRGKYQEDHVGYVTSRFIAYLEDQDRPV
jgi:hypothetical protein